jgi:hypothetical protein
MESSRVDVRTAFDPKLVYPLAGHVNVKGSAVTLVEHALE